MSELEISGNYTYIEDNDINNNKHINIKEITEENKKKLNIKIIKNIYVENNTTQEDKDGDHFDITKYISHIIDKNLNNLENDKNNNINNDFLYSDENIEYILYNNKNLYIKNNDTLNNYKFKKIFILQQ